MLIESVPILRLVFRSVVCHYYILYLPPPPLKTTPLGRGGGRARGFEATGVVGVGVIILGVVYLLS